MRVGLLCKACGPQTCLDCPTESEPVEIDCPACEGVGCTECDELGHFEVIACPKRQIDRELVDCLPFAELYKQGIPPIGAGSLEQTHWFTNFCLSLWGDEERIRSQHKII